MLGVPHIVIMIGMLGGTPFGDYDRYVLGVPHIVIMVGMFGSLDPQFEVSIDFFGPLFDPNSIFVTPDYIGIRF